MSLRPIRAMNRPPADALFMQSAKENTMDRRGILFVFLVTASAALTSADHAVAQSAWPERLVTRNALAPSTPDAARAFALARQRSAAQPRQPDRIVAGAEVAPCAYYQRGRCMGRDPDPTVRFMLRHDSSMVND